MNLRHPHLAWLLGLMCLAGLGACGPAPSDKTSPFEPRASLGGVSQSPSISQSAPVPRTDPDTPAASPAPLASSLSPYGHVQAQPTETLIGPDGMSAALRSPDARVRLWALDHWERHALTRSLDPLLEALDDEDEDVQEKASAIIERYWALE